MRKILEVPIKETAGELRSLQKKYPSKFKPLQMLLLIKKQGLVKKTDLALQLSSSANSIHTWRQKYLHGGLQLLLSDKRGGNKKACITPFVHQQLAKRLGDPKGGFRSFTELQRWLNEEFDIVMQYHAVNKYVKRKFGARLKVSRKSHVQKSPLTKRFLKKPVR